MSTSLSWARTRTLPETLQSGNSPGTRIAAGHSAEEAKQLLLLESAVLKRKGLSKASNDAAKAAGEAALGVQTELAAIPKLEKARTAATRWLDALAQAWETAFAGLKRAGRRRPSRSRARLRRRRAIQAARDAGPRRRGRR